MTRFYAIGKYTDKAFFITFISILLLPFYNFYHTGAVYNKAFQSRIILNYGSQSINNNSREAAKGDKNGLLSIRVNFILELPFFFSCIIMYQ